MGWEGTGTALVMFSPGMFFCQRSAERNGAKKGRSFALHLSSSHVGRRGYTKKQWVVEHAERFQEPNGQLTCSVAALGGGTNTSQNGSITPQPSTAPLSTSQSRLPSVSRAGWL